MTGTLPVAVSGMNSTRVAVSSASARTQGGTRREANSRSETQPTTIGASTPAAPKAIGMRTAPTLSMSGSRRLTSTGPTAGSRNGPA